MLDSASTSADGFIWSISGQARAPAPTASVDQVTRSRKSRRVAPSAVRGGRVGGLGHWRTPDAAGDGMRRARAAIYAAAAGANKRPLVA